MTTVKNGKARGIQTYACRHCHRCFSAKRRTTRVFQKHLWSDYVFRKQTLKELSVAYVSDPRTLRGLLGLYTPPPKQHDPRPVHLVVDGTYFGKRTNESMWCVVVARDPYQKENLWWAFTSTETTSIYVSMREDLEKRGYTILSVTGDGFGGIQSAFVGIPYQMCHVHMERIVTYGTTKKPKLEAGRVLLALVRTLKNTNSHVFATRLTMFTEKYQSLLNEKTFHPESGEWSWTHEELRRATRALEHWRVFLFTYEHNNAIPKTTNSLEGHFRHLKRLVRVHCGLSKKHKTKVLYTILLAGTTSSTTKKLQEIL